MQWIENFKDMYAKLDASNLDLLEQFYHPEAVFVDPFHRVQGLPQIKEYFAALYSNVEAISFNYNWQMADDSQVVIGWTMTYQHPRINRGKSVALEGVSRISLQDNLIIQHQDYFDGGSMLYEHLPVLGAAIRFVKGRMVAA
ncbi:nuclear transport factor 2 family protein [Neiella sp. HB171785]|uniref:Nuclear transport factor 2 family protein n=1 Tax=Neiella litorisoli TaxID=2771431 RepID=A0A8J6UPI7_9GAMM|nr:nuclear transport factor 2 family protein [Neiella litorisoli]MBD1388517.1 nuclear transport factor 2 family protein [Neiella litorisoli]